MCAFRSLVVLLLLAWIPPAHAARIALVVGVSEYRDPGIPDLRYAAADARAFATMLREKAGFTEVVELLDGAATREAVQTALARTLPRQARAEDVVVVFYSGHGAPEPDLSGDEPDGLRKYLVTADADPDNLLVTAIDMRDVARWLDWIPAQTVLAFFDACHSGGVGGRGLAGRYRGVEVASIPRPTGQGRVTLSASQANQVSLELDALGHGLFTWALLEGLAGAGDGNGDGAVTLTELYAWLGPEVARAARQMDTRQDPRFDGTLTGEVVLVDRAGGPDPARERARLAAVEAGIREREARLAERKAAAAEALRVTRLADSAEAVPVDEKIALWERFLRDWRGEPGAEEAEQRLAWWRSAHQTWLDVEVNLPDAELRLDGALVGTGSRTISGVPLGTHRLVVSAPLHHPWQDEVVLPLGGAKVRVALRPAYGRVEIASTPPGAEVFHGDVRLGVTPLVLPQAASGALRLTLRAPRHFARDTYLEVRDGETTRVAETLPPRFGTLALGGLPEGAQVSVAGRRVGVPPSGVVEVDAGLAELRVEKAGARPWSTTVEIVAGQPSRLQVPPLVILSGTLSVVSEPRGAEVSLDGRVVGTAPLTLADLPAGPHQLALRAGALGWSGEVQVTPDQVTLHTATLRAARPGMVYVAAGPWIARGGTPGTLDAYFLDRTEVSNQAWARCVAAGACRAPRIRAELARPDLPVVNVTWQDASAYCAWIGGRLPTGAEWERAARGTDGRLYPWGNTWAERTANWNDGGRVDGFALTASVDAFADHPSPAGALNMAGNVLEWTADAVGAGRGVRGGSALMEGGPEGLKVTTVHAVPADAASEGIGVRCAADP